jgi:hypothetical protein
MKEYTLKKFLQGEASGEELASDVADAFARQGVLAYHPIVDMSGEYEVTSFDLLKLCSEVLNGNLPVEHLQPIGFCLLASSHFQWDADTPDGYRVSEVIHEWSCPEVNYPLTYQNVQKWKEFLLTGKRSM